MTPVPLEATQGATAAAVGQAHRRQQVRDSHAAQVRQIRSLERLVAWLGGRPELCFDGEPCIFAVAGGVLLRDRWSGDPDAFAVLVQRYRRSRIAKAVADGLLDERDAERWLGAAT